MHMNLFVLFKLTLSPVWRLCGYLFHGQLETLVHMYVYVCMCIESELGIVRSVSRSSRGSGVFSVYSFVGYYISYISRLRFTYSVIYAKLFLCLNTHGMSKKTRGDDTFLI